MIAIIGGAGFVGTRLKEVLKKYHSYDLRKTSEDEFMDIRDPDTIQLMRSIDSVVLLAAVHADDVSPTSKYYDTNVSGTQNVLDAMDKIGVKRLVFTSSVAVYGLNKDNPNEQHPVDPFNHYGKSKWEAEKVIRAWYDKDPIGKSVIIIRPTVIFGEKNRGNVFNLLKQIAIGKFIMIGDGKNRKSMAYVGNVASFIKNKSEIPETGYNVYNYVDKPDFTMSTLVESIEKSLDRSIPSIRIPKWLGYLGGFGFDMLAFLTRKKFSISSVRVKKFVATTQFDATKVHSGDFKAPFTLKEGLDRTLDYEFVQERSEDDKVFYTE